MVNVTKNNVVQYLAFNILGEEIQNEIGTHCFNQNGFSIN